MLLPELAHGRQLLLVLLVRSSGNGGRLHCSCSVSRSAGGLVSASEKGGASAPGLIKVRTGKVAVLHTPRVMQVNGAGVDDGEGVLVGVGVMEGVTEGVVEPRVQVRVRMR